MKRLKFDTDIQPLSEFRANAAAMIEMVKNNHRPLVLTQHGKSSAVLLDVSDYEKLIEELELLREVNKARQELQDGEGHSHETLMKSLRERLKQVE